MLLKAILVITGITLASGRTVGKFHNMLLKLMYSEKATKFCEVSSLDLSNVVSVKST